MTLDQTLEIITQDPTVRFTVDHYPGIAWRVIGPELDHDEMETGWLIMVMVGDNRRHSIEPCEISLLDDHDYCYECGQVGCAGDFRS